MGRRARGGGSRVRIVVVVERRYLAQAQPVGLVSALRRRGGAVRVLEADTHATRIGRDADWLADTDLVVVRGRSTSTLAMAAWAEAAGVPTVNTRAATERVRNKAELAVALAQAGIPCPPTVLGGVREIAAELAPDDYPILLKPVFGDNADGLRLVPGPQDMSPADWQEGSVLAQRFLPSDGSDLKLYAIGDAVFAVRKPSPLRPEGNPDAGDMAMPITVTRAMRELALRCGRLFGLELFGVDCIEGTDGPLVIEVNEFPNYTGVPAADELLADHVLRLVANAPVAHLELEPT